MIALYCVSMVVGLYTTFVLTVLWDWFASPALHVDHISFWMMYGLTMFIGLLGARNTFEDDRRHKVYSVVLDACIPESRREEVLEQLKDLEAGTWVEAGWKVFGQIVTNTMALGFGFAVHILASL